MKNKMNISCTICGKQDKVTLKDDRLHMYRCSSCDHEFSLIDKAVQEKYDNDYYRSTHANWFNNPDYRLFGFIYSNVKKMIRKEKIRILDVGCGKGDLLKFIQKRDPLIELYGVDLCENDLEGIHFARKDFLKEEHDVKADVVTSLAAIEHLDDVSLFFERVKSSLLPGGIVVIMTENTGGAFYSMARFLKKVGLSTPFYSLYEPAHLNHFTNRSLRILAEDHGFEIVKQENHNYPIKAVNFPPANQLVKVLYLTGVAALFSLPKRFGILQTLICKLKN